MIKFDMYTNEIKGMKLKFKLTLKVYFTFKLKVGTI